MRPPRPMACHAARVLLPSAAMRRRDFYYTLPEALIAQRPLAARSASRLLCLDGVSGELRDRQFADIVGELDLGDLLILNDTCVIPARLFARKQTGGAVEVLIERLLDEHRVLAQIRASKSPKPGGQLELDDGLRAEVVGREGEFFDIRFLDPRPVLDILSTQGHVPLPPYIRRADENDDRVRYQTVYARHPGAIAAPTAGLHFDAELLRRLTDKGVELGYLTLHVGASTFQPVRVDDIAQHRMHAEYVEVSDAVCEAIARCKQRGGRVVAVGTTTVRALETAAAEGELKPFEGETRIFIIPGFAFRVVDALITNFHLPESTLLMLVSAFGGHKQVMAAYEHAVRQRYRFYSYGDAMFVTSKVASSKA